MDSLGFVGGASERLRLHDLIREFAVDTAGTTPSAGESRSLEHDAVARAVQALLQALVPADARADQLGFLAAGPLWRATRNRLTHGSHAPEHDVEDAYTLALVIIRRGCEVGLVEQTWPLALALTALQDRKGLLIDWRQMNEVVLQALTASTGDPTAIAAVVASIANEQLARGAADEAVVTFQRAADLATQLHDREAVLWARAGEATALHYDRRSPQARPLLVEVAAQARTHGAGDALWHASLTLAQLLLDEGCPAEAISCLDEAERATTGAMPSLWLATFRYETSRFHLNLGNLAAAERALDEALRVFRDIASPIWEAAALRQVGRLHERRSQYQAALLTFEECLQVFESVGDLRWAGWVLGDIAQLHIQQGDTAAAMRSLADARTRLTALGDNRGLARLAEIEATDDGAPTESSRA
jgi:tetratricopeptide (TPR) repeat protein